MDILLTFSTTRHAIAAEHLLLGAGENVRVMPLPGDIAAGCGICLRVPLERRREAAAALEMGGVPALETYLRLDSGFRTFPNPVFSQALGLRKGDAVALVGCAGKTSLANRLAAENRDGRVLFSTTTKILEPPDSVVDWRLADSEPLRRGVTLACRQCGEKLCGIAAGDLERLRPADGLTIVEADGSRGLPLKGWAEYEPAVPRFASVTIGVCSVGPVGQPFSDAVAHRPELFAAMTGAAPGEPIRVGHIAAMAGEMARHAVGRMIVYVNQVETPEQERLARELAERLDGMRVVAGSVRDGTASVLKEG